MANNTEARSSSFLLGQPDSSICGVGTFAVDYMATAGKSIPQEVIQSGGKLAVATKEEFDGFVRQYDIRRGKMYPGSSTANCLNQIARVVEGTVPIHAFTAFSPTDDTTRPLLDALQNEGIYVHQTDFRVDDPLHPALNPTALLIEDGLQTKIFSYKDNRMPAIRVTLDEVIKPGVIISGASAGDGAQTIYNTIEAAKATQTPIVILGTSSEIGELARNPRLKRAYEEKMRQGNFFIGNMDEAKALLLAMNEFSNPSTDGIVLIQQVREIFNNDELDFLLTMGADGSMAVIGETIYEEKETPLDPKNFKSTAGAGDAKAGAFIAGVHIKGTDHNGIFWTLPRSTLAAHCAMERPDARSGQISRDRFLTEDPGFKIHVSTLNRWV